MRIEVKRVHEVMDEGTKCSPRQDLAPFVLTEQEKRSLDSPPKCARVSL